VLQLQEAVEVVEVLYVNQIHKAVIQDPVVVEKVVVVEQLILQEPQEQ